LTGHSRRILVYWMPAVLWTAVILGTSNDLFSARYSGDWLGEIIIRIVGHPLPPREFNIVHFLLRKGVHLTSYFILGALFFRALRGDDAGWRARWALIAVTLAASVATLDEWHQLFVVSRSGSAWDVMLDGVGATIAQWVWRYGCNLSRS
jgi:VanZ family protein